MAGLKDRSGAINVDTGQSNDNRRRWVYLFIAASILLLVLAISAELLSRRNAPSTARPSVPTSTTTLAATLAAVAPTVPSGQVAVGTQVSIPKIGLSVQLPGSGWTSTIPDDYPDTRSERWYNADKSLVFAVFLFDDHMKGGHAGLKTFGEEFAHDFQMIPTGASMDVSFQGIRAWRIEGTGQGQQDTFGPEYRFVEYWLEKEDGVYLIVAGSKAEQWENGGAEKVEAILGSVNLDR